MRTKLMPQMMSAQLDHLLSAREACNNGAEIGRLEGRPLIVAGETVGVVLPLAAEQFARFPK
eukprot:6468828-Amphidinium_carterae.1